MSLWTDFNAFVEKHEKATLTATLVILLIVIAYCLVGCGTSSDRQTKTVERVTTQTAPITLDTPIGQIVIQPTQVTVNREQSEVEQERKSFDLPQVGAIMQAAASGTPFGAIIGSVLGFGGVAGALHQMLRAKNASRQRDEVIDSFETVTDHMTDDQWNAAREKIKQSPDTKLAVHQRIS